jgi:CheY-like chemotaxis protein
LEKSPPEVDYYFRERSQRLANEQQELFRVRVPISDAVGPKVKLASSAIGQKGDADLTKPAEISPEMARHIFLGAVLLFLIGVLVVRRFAPDLVAIINQKFNPWALTSAAGSNAAAVVYADEEAFAEFRTAFQAGPLASTHTSSLAVASSKSISSGEAGKCDSSGESDLIKEFYSRAAKLLVAQRQLIQDIGRVSDRQTRRTMLKDLRREVCALKGEAGLPALLLVWQVASVLEGLIKQLIDKVANLTPSTLRTVAGGLDLLENLCVPGLKADNLTSQPLRFLAVDDDLITRNVMSLALKKALNPPDLAVDGETALALVTKQAYDVIFLDVQMPGMDGFELCTKIHETVPNSNTPVVFVTCQSDFEARARATVSGGSDLIAKPFITFEIAVKALTLALKGRLQGQAQTIGAHKGVNVAAASSPAKARAIPAQNHIPEINDGTATAVLPEICKAGDLQGQSLPGRDGLMAATPAVDRANLPQQSPPTFDEMMPDSDNSIPSSELSPNELAQAFLTRASSHLGPLRDLIQECFATRDENARQGMLADFYLRLNSFTPQSDTAKGHPAVQMCVALEGLLKKLLQDPKHGTSSTLLTVATAVDLLIDLCAPGAKSGLTNNKPIRTLAVDDDPIARRAITCALQMVFEKPESVDNGEAALALATEKPFDVIFLDVQMPGMDGFTTCLRIRETVHNRTTPVVFVTGHSDFKARSQSTVSGGNDLIAKPFLNAEIKVKALTYALRGRLQNLKTEERLRQFQNDNGQTRNDLVPVLA